MNGSPVTRGRRVRPKAKAQTFEAMPQENQDAAKRLEKFSGLKREDYVKNYWKAEGANNG